ncbi:MAG: response regulator [Deltaproteobacteria bacterium]|nr:response regulator [Deltaproteobacteria bacterium]
MGVGVDPLGQLLLARGVLDDEGLAELLGLQQQQLPLASLCYLVGAASEDQLVGILSRQFGVPGVVLGRSAIDLRVLGSVPRELALEGLILPVQSDDSRIFCACRHPDRAEEFLRQVSFIKGKPVVPYVALHIALYRVIREVYAALECGERYYVAAGAHSPVDGIAVVSEAATIPAAQMGEGAVGAVMEDVTKEVSVVDLDLIYDEDEPGDTTSLPTQTTSVGRFLAEGSEETPAPLTGVHLQPDPDANPIDLDGTATEAEPRRYRQPGGPARVLVVDDDFATRNLLVKELLPDGYNMVTAGNGGEAVRMLKSDPPDAVIIDVMLPQIDGFQVCRAIKNSVKYRHIPVVLMSAVIDSGRVTDQVLEQYGADAYFEKPLNTNRLREQLRSLLTTAKSNSEAVDDGNFDRAMTLYRSGRIDDAIGLLRSGLEVDPLSARHHFVLANLLQKQSLIYEAIDEYETTVDLMPDYFPALTRLAYLYYKKGFAAKAIETWRRALPHCPDSGLRKNIEVFMRKLISDMQ